MPDNIVDDSDEEIIALAEPLLQNMLDGGNALKYAKFSRDFSHGMRSTIPEDLFAEQSIAVNRARGQCISRQPLGVLRKNKTALILWSARFDKSNDDMLIQLKIAYDHGKLVITGATIT
ncbi:MAG: hypothetical protein PVJ39_15390 [Gammaproteobacteria bacterium]|jgi:hypothetical protein